MRVCFERHRWAVTGTEIGEYVIETRPVMRLEDLTLELAQFLDTRIDGRADARFVQFRFERIAADPTDESAPWSDFLSPGEQGVGLYRLRDGV